MSKKTYAIVAGIIGAVTTAIESIIHLFNLPKESLIIGAFLVFGSAAIGIVACFVDPTKQLERK